MGELGIGRLQEIPVGDRPPVLVAMADGLVGLQEARQRLVRRIVVTVGGTSSITGPFLASILLGIGDVAGKYYVPKLGAFVIYAIMIVVLLWRPQGLFARSTAR